AYLEDRRQRVTLRTLLAGETTRVADRRDDASDTRAVQSPLVSEPRIQRVVAQRIGEFLRAAFLGVLHLGSRPAVGNVRGRVGVGAVAVTCADAKRLHVLEAPAQRGQGDGRGVEVTRRSTTRLLARSRGIGAHSATAALNTRAACLFNFTSTSAGSASVRSS